MIVYDSYRAKCVSLAGTSCAYYADPITRIRGDCVSHANCANEMCECDPGFYANLNGTCEEQQLGQPCSSNEMCSQSHSVCGSEGTCDCDNTTSLYDSTRKTCLVKAGSICSRSSRRNGCIENAHCEFGSLKCVCNSNYFKNTEGICERKRNYGELCVDNTYCNPHIIANLTDGQKKEINSYIICKNGTCGCNSEIAVEYEDNLNSIRICGKRLGKECNERKDNCLANSECYRNTVCKCISTHYEIDNETCADKKGYGESCQSDKECNINLLARLICDQTENVCTCENGTLRHPDFPERCAISAKKSKMSCSMFNPVVCISDCVPNAKCESRGVCKCDDNTVTSPNQKGYCFIREGDSCFGDMRSPITNRTCLPGLLCQNDRCSCAYVNHQEYDEKEEKCSTLINGPCNKSSECTHNSECIDDDGLKVCRCKKGFNAVDRKCDLAYGESCVQGQSYPKCDRLGPLQCNANNKCGCLPFEFYDSTELKCRKGLAGARCNLGIPNFCVEGAECKGFRSLDRKWGICRCLANRTLQEDGKCGNRTSFGILKEL